MARLSGESKSTVIKPPMEKIESGKIVKPAMKLLWKEYLSIACVAGFLWTIGVLFWLLVAYMSLVFDETITVSVFLIVYIPTYWPLALVAGLGLFIFLVLPFWVLYPLYFRNIEYSVISASGESMPEIYVKKGLLNITKKHVPLPHNHEYRKQSRTSGQALRHWHCGDRNSWILWDSKAGP